MRCSGGLTDDACLSASAREAIADESNAILVSAASAWKIAARHRLGKLDEATGAVGRYDELVACCRRIRTLADRSFHALKAGGHEVAHRNPFDRMLVAQSEPESVPLVTVDPVFGMFGIRIFWQRKRQRTETAVFARPNPPQVIASAARGDDRLSCGWQGKTWLGDVNC